MKTSSILAASLLLGGVNLLQAQPAAKAMPADTDYAVTERGANHRVWQRTTYEQGPNGKVVPHVHSYTELATGMHYKDAKTGQWVESKEEIEPFPGGAVARKGPQQVIFANNLNSAGAIDLQTPDGKRLRSNILGLMYFDTATGDAVMIARLQDSAGELISTNQVLYPNAFDDVKADVRYTYKRDGFEQDVILREQPPAPDVYGMNPDTTVLEVVTEFINPPPATVTEQSGAADDRIDETVAWGMTAIGHGRAFNLGAQDSTAKVFKRYVTIQGRHFLMEKVLLRDIKAPLSKLPEQAVNQQRLPVLASKNPVLPKTPPAKADAKPIRMALASMPDKGYVLDYVTLNASYTNYTFQGDMTYYVTGPLNLYDTTTIEGGAVVKVQLNPYVSALNIFGLLDCRTGPYRPVIFTAKDDNAVGETISGSTGAPSGYYAKAPLYFDQTTSGASFDLHDVRASYFLNGVVKYAYPSSVNGVVRDSQFFNVGTAIYGGYGDQGSFEVKNVLIYKADTAFADSLFAVQNATLDQVNNMGYGGIAGYDTGALYVTNSLLVAVTNLGNFTSINNATNSSSSAVFKTVGAGGHYLATNSPYRNAGTTNIDSTLLAELQQKTTYPPIVYSNTTISVATTFSPQAQRDTDAPDLGYHYDPLDYVFGGCVLNTNLTFASGTVAAWFESSGSTYLSGQPYGVALNNGANITAMGTISQPCWVVRFNLVQEGGNGVWGNRGWMSGMVLNGSGSAVLPQINAQFTKWSGLNGFGGYWRDNWAYGVVHVANSEFYNAGFGSYRPSHYFTNCLFKRVMIANWDQSDAPNLTFLNCTFYNGALVMVRYSWQSSSFWTVKNTIFDGTAFAWDDNFNGDTNHTDFNYNAYNTNNLSWQTYPYPYPPTYGTLEVVGTNDVMLGDFNWQTSWLGDFYLPYDSALIDAGSTNADLLGLYHFTTQVYQAKETNSLVDIGYHYVAVDYYTGIPVDTDSDGISDYLEDANGNGTVDSGETDWQNAFDLGLRVKITRPQNGSSLP